MAVKAYYGRYFEGAAGGFFESAVPGIEDFARYPILSNGQLGPPTVLVPGIVYGISSDINHPRTDEFNMMAVHEQTDGKILGGVRAWLLLRMWSEEPGGGRHDLCRWDQSAGYSRTSGAGP